VRITAEQIFISGSRMGAFQTDIAPAQDGYQVSYLVDGVRQAGDRLPAPVAVKVIDFWKQAAGLDVEDRRRRLTGKVSVKTEAEQVDTRVTSMGSKGGMRLTLTSNPSSAVRIKAENLGLLDMQYEAVRTLASEEEGVVLLGAPSHGGRSTTLYAMLKLHDAYTSNVQTVEMEPQDALEGIRQIQFEPYKEGSEYSVTVRSVLRRDPDVVGIAELPDEATAREVAGADVERTRIYVSLNVESALSATQLFVKAVGDANKAAECLRGVIAQRLARKLCENCRVPYAPPPEMLKKLGLPADKVKQLFKKGGQVLIRNKPEICPVCQGIGYKGQTGLFEVFRIGQAERAIIREQNWSGLRAEFRKQQLPDIQQAALRKAVEGVTSIEEIQRISTPAKRKPSAPAKPESGSQQPAAT
jgi:type II secretory ATPase GspE/PulE/Tfp pilus assembly ATPase PilB-like protein